MVTGKQLTLPNQCSTAATIKSRTSSPAVYQTLFEVLVLGSFDWTVFVLGLIHSVLATT